MKPELEAAVQHAYRVFADYRVTDPVAVCRHCTTEAALREMVAVPVWDWSDKLLREHSFAVAVSVIDDQTPLDNTLSHQLRAVLPRYLEQVAHDDVDPAALKPYGAARYRDSWPAMEAAALDAFYEAYLRTSSDDTLSFALKTAASGGASAEPIIAAIRRDPESVAVVTVARAIEALSWAHGKLEVEVYSDVGTCCREAEAVRDWLLSPAQELRLEVALAVAAERDDESTWDTLTAALDVVQLHRGTTSLDT